MDAGVEARRHLLLDHRRQLLDVDAEALGDRRRLVRQHLVISVSYRNLMAGVILQ